MTSAPHSRSLPTLRRRSVLAGTAGAAGAAALGLGAPALAAPAVPASGDGPGRGVRWRKDHVFPSFRGAGTVRVADGDQA